MAGALVRHWMVAGEWRAHPTQVLLGTVAIAVGVALGFAVHLINGSALSEFTRAVDTVDGGADLEVRGVGAAGFDEALYPALARLKGIAAASPVIELAAAADEAGPGPVGPPKGDDRAITLVGIDAMRAGGVTPGLIGVAAEGADGAGVIDPHNLFLSAAAIRSIGCRIGDRLTLRVGAREAAFMVAGTLPAVPDQDRLGMIDIAAAQWRFNRLGRLDRVDLKLASDADAAEVRQAVTAILPADAVIATRESEVRRGDALSRAYRVNLDILALVALLTGGFLIYSAQALSVARRRRHFALLRVLGARQRDILLQVLAEGAVLGIAGGGLGLLLGLGLAAAALALFGGDLGGGYFSGTAPRLVISPIAGLVFLVLGIAGALAGSLLPGIEAARALPAIALKARGEAIDPEARPPRVLPLLFLMLGGLASLAPPIAGLPIMGYGAMALLLAGGIAAMPYLARAALRPLARIDLRPVPLSLAVGRLWGAPSQASVALCGIVASTSLTIAMAVMVTSFRGSVDDWLGQVLSADVYFRALDGTEDGIFDRPTRERLAAAPGVRRLDFIRATTLDLVADRPAVSLIARPIDRQDPGATLPMLATAAIPAGRLPVWVSEPLARLDGIHVGDTLSLPLDRAGRSPLVPVFVAGEWRDYVRQYGAIAIDMADYAGLSGDDTADEGAVFLDEGTRPDQAIEALRRALPAALARRVGFSEPRLLRTMALKLFDRSFAVTYLLEIVALIVGLAGVATTISAQTLARTREFGMLRHLGVTRAAIAAMLMIEGALLGAVGGLAGIGLGLVMSQVLIQVVNPQSFHWGMATRVPILALTVIAGLLVLASAGTARLAGARALSIDAVRAVREDE